MAGIGMNLGAGLSQGYSQSANSGGSVNSAENNSYSYNSSWNDAWSDAMSQAYSWTEAQMARQWSAQVAQWAWEKDMEAFHEQMDFNREEAEKQRAWQAQMANSIYTRSVKNMKEAGINPILAYSMGLSGAGVGSGATASLGGSPQAPLAQNFMDSYSASNSNSHSEQHGGSFGESWGTGWSDGTSWNSGWSNSEEGIVTALQGLSGMADSALGLLNSGNTMAGITNALGGNGSAIGRAVNNVVKSVVNNPIEKMADRIQNKLDEHRKDNTKALGGGGGYKKLKK